MKFTNVNIMGGDVQCYGIESLPENLKKVTNIKEKIIARGEISGHCHILTGDVELFKDEKGNLFACVGSDGAYHQHYKESMVKEETFNELKNISNCDHTKECKLPKGNYSIGIDRQYDPNAKSWIKNVD